MYQNIIEQSDLTPKEAQIYEIALQLGETPVKDIIKKTGDHPHVVYRVLEKLSKEGLISIFLRKNKKYIQAENPSVLENRIKNKLKDIQEIMPALLAMQKNDQSSRASIMKGKEAVRAVRERIIDELPEGGEYYIIAATDDTYYQIMGRFHTELDKKRIAKNIKRKMVAYASSKTMLKQNDWFTKLTDQRFLPEKYSSPMSTTIYNNTVVIYVLTDDPVVFTIENEIVAENFKKYFQTLWNTAK